MFKLFNIFKVAGRRLILLNGVYDLKNQELQGHWEEISTPKITTTSISPFVQVQGTPSNSKNITLTGKNLLGNVLVFAPEGYEISEDGEASTWVTELEFVVGVTKTLDQTLYIRLNTEDLGTVTGSIKIFSPYLVYQYVSLTGYVIEDVGFGYYYNRYVISDTRNVASSGWRVPTDADMTTLSTYLDPLSTAGGKMKEEGTTHWNSPNTGATNEVHFNGRGAGARNSLGEFYGQLNALYVMISNLINGFFSASAISEELSINDSGDNNSGFSIRFIKEDTSLVDGEEGIYIGNDGRVYRTICIGTQEWLADNLKETKFRNGENIDQIQDDTEWANATDSAYCIVPLTACFIELVYVQIFVGYNNVRFIFADFSSGGSGNLTHTLQYTTNGSTWIDSTVIDDPQYWNDHLIVSSLPNTGTYLDIRIKVYDNETTETVYSNELNALYTYP